jgi:hypothetical protein
MKIFLAGIMQGSKPEMAIHDQSWREPMRDVLLRHFPDAEIYCHYSRHRDSVSYEKPDIRTTFDEGVQACVDSDLVVCYLPSASMGTAIEMEAAYRNGTKVISVTPMDSNWVVQLYSHAIVSDFDALDTYLKEHASIFQSNH